jgi:Fe-S-cluster containining protein
MGTPESCTCAECKRACERKPGWFLPGEVEAVAEHLGITLAELFTSKLAVDWWEDTGDDERITHDIFVLAPAITTSPPGTEYPGNPEGRCVFYVEGRCTIHPVKPFECRAAFHTDNDHGVIQRQHADVAVAWDEHQGQITDLLGREPEAEEWDFGGLFGMLGRLTDTLFATPEGYEG